MNNTANMSKSARRRLRQKLNAAKQVVVVPQVQNNAPSRRRRNRNRRKRSGNRTIQNEYLNTILYPETCRGCKVPDLVSFPTSTFQLRFNGYLDAGTGGKCVALKFTPIIGDGGTYFPVYTYSGSSVDSLSTVVTHDWPGALASLQDMYGMFRPVSASVQVAYVGDSDTDGGVIMGSLQPRSFEDTSNSDLDTFVEWANLPGMVEYPMREGIRVIWKPQDNSDLEFSNVLKQQAHDEHHSEFPSIAIVAKGTQSSFSAKLRFNITANYEATPALAPNILDDRSEPSPSNLGMLQEAFNYFGNVKSTAQSMLSYIAPVASDALATIAPKLLQSGTSLALNAALYRTVQRQRIEL